VEEKVASIGQDSGIARQSIADVVDRRHLRPMHSEQEVPAEESGQLVGLRCVNVEIYVDCTKDEEVVIGERIVFGKGVRREAVFGRQFMKSEPLLEQWLERLARRVLNVDPQPVVAIAFPRVDEISRSLFDGAAAQNRDA